MVSGQLSHQPGAVSAHSHITVPCLQPSVIFKGLDAAMFVAETKHVHHPTPLDGSCWFQFFGGSRSNCSLGRMVPDQPASSHSLPPDSTSPKSSWSCRYASCSTKVTGHDIHSPRAEHAQNRNRGRSLHRGGNAQNGRTVTLAAHQQASTITHHHHEPSCHPTPFCCHTAIVCGANEYAAVRPLARQHQETFTS